MAYVRWYNARAKKRGEPFEYRLPTEVHHYIACAPCAKFVWGDRFLQRWVKSCFSRPRATLEPVMSFPVDESRYGIYDLYDLEVRGDLVVLSTCESGVADVTRGDEVLGLTRGFLYAGAENVLVSLWRADDVGTRDLMVPFYRNLLSGVPRAAALREAKVEFIEKSPKHARPYYWAPFVLIGQ